MSVCAKYKHFTSFCDRCESLAEIIWHNRQQIKEVERLKQKLALEPPGVVDVLPNLNIQITQLLSSLVTR